eukprot:CAMPEP_0119141078 /NCGR_PEP_ID=MMETSP1310-20130426/30371_1 /TAXON_ID=464262 /ORGANISM="Genus nov. species nov., Strain RCC2339" /LENGTH=54 /DNA_ID=CAMNT_0007132497 /DNA_START=62 /DNA_END=222 /DNA_ORIENTATION=-
MRRKCHYCAGREACPLATEEYTASRTTQGPSPNGGLAAPSQNNWTRVKSPRASP